MSRGSCNFFSPPSIFILNVLRDLKVPSPLEITNPVRPSFGKHDDVAASLAIIPMFSIFCFRVPFGRNSGGNERRFLVVFQISSVVFLFFFFRATKFTPFQYQISLFSKCSRPDFSHPVPLTRLRLLYYLYPHHRQKSWRCPCPDSVSRSDFITAFQKTVAELMSLKMSVLGVGARERKSKS